MVHFIKYFHSEAVKWCEGRSWPARLPLAVMFLFLFGRYINNPGYVSVFFWVNFFIHEAGHVLFHVFFPSGDILGFMGGTILQCLIPVISIFVFFRQRDFFAVSFCFGWLSTNLFHVSWYIFDARYSDGIAVNPFGNEGLHDWYYILNHFGVFRYTILIGGIVRIFAIIFMLVSLVFGFYLLWQMFISAKRTDNNY